VGLPNFAFVVGPPAHVHIGYFGAELRTYVYML